MNPLNPQPQISPELFIWEKYISKLSYGVSEVFDGNYTFAPDVEVIGFCPSNRLPVRPRTSGFAVMVRFRDREEEEEFWLHYS